MIVLLFVSLLATFLTYLEGEKKLKGGMKLGFAIVILTAAIRDDYGSDFENYLDWFTQVSKNQLGLLQIISKDAIFGVDNGWSLLCYIFSPFGFNFFVAATTIFTGIVFYKFIQDNVDPKWRWIAVFVYLFTTQMFVLGLSMMRQSFAITLFVLSFSFVKKKKTILPIALMLLASTIHSSAIITIPFIFLNRLNYNKHRIFSCILVFLYIGSIFVAKYTSDMFNLFSSLSTFERYTDTYTNELEFELGIGFIVMQLPYLLYIIHAWRYSVPNNLGAALVMSCIPFYLLSFKEVAMSERLGYYFIPFSIICIPLVISALKKKNLQFSFLFIYIVITLYSYNAFFVSPIWRTKYFEYHSIFG